MKKTISYLAATCLALGALTVPAHASATVITAGTAEGKAGDTVSIPISMSGCEGFSNLSLEVGYDSDILSLTAAKQNRDVDADYVASQYLTVDPYVLTWNNIVNTTYEGELVTLSFKIDENTEPGTYPVTVSFYKGENGDYVDGDSVNFDENFDPLEMQYINGSITVKGNEPSYKTTMEGIFSSSANEPPAAAFTADVSSGSYNVTGLTWNLTKDNATTGDVPAKNVNIAKGTTVTFGFIVSIDAAGIDAGSITADDVTIKLTK